MSKSWEEYKEKRNQEIAQRQKTRESWEAYKSSRQSEGADETASTIDELRKKYGTASKEEVDAIGKKYSTGSDLSNQTDVADKIAALRAKYGYHPEDKSALEEQVNAIGQKYAAGGNIDVDQIRNAVADALTTTDKKQSETDTAQKKWWQRESDSEPLGLLELLGFVGRSGDSTLPLNNATVVTHELRENADQVEEQLENSNSINTKKAQQEEKTQQWAKEHPVAASAASVLASPLAGVGALRDLVEINAVGSVLPHEDQTPGELSQNLREGVSEDMSGAGKLFYDAGMSVADSYLASILGGGMPGVGGGILAGGVMSSAMDDARERGGDNRKAVLSGMSAAVAEFIGETLSIGQLDMMKNAPVDSAKTMLKNWLKGAITNASEEAVTETANTLMDIGIMGELSNYSLLVKDGLTQGLSEAEAKSRAKGELAKQVGQSALVGAIAGTGTSALASAQSVAGQKLATGADTTAKPANDVDEHGENRNIETATEIKQSEKSPIQQNESAVDTVSKPEPQPVKLVEKEGLHAQSAEPQNLATEAETGVQEHSSASTETTEITNSQRPVSEPSVAQETAVGGATDNDITNMEVTNNGGEKEISVSGVGQRADSKSPGGEERGVAGKAEAAQSGDDDSEPADSGADSLLYGGKVSAATYGIAGGSSTRNLRTVRGGESEATKAAKQIAEKNGLALTLFGGGNLKLTDKNGAEYEARGYVEDISLMDSVLTAKGSPLSGKTVRAYVRADHPLFTAEQLTKHEVGHRMIARREINPDTVRARVADTFGAERVEQLAQMYAEAYEGSGLTPAQIWNEVICDSIADMNIFSAKANIAPTTKSAGAEMTTESAAVNEALAPVPETTGEASRETKPVSVTEEQSAELGASREAVRATVREELERMGKEYGWIKAGESPARTVELPKQTSDDKKVSQTIRTVMEAQTTPDEVLPTLESMVADGEFSHEVYGDEAAVNDAKEYISNRGWGDAQREWFKAMEKGEVSKRNTAVGWTLYNNAVNSGDTETAIDILNSMVEHQRNAAQALQATRILKKMSPETQLYAVQKSVARLQQELNDRYGGKKKGSTKITIDPELAEQMLNAPDQKGRDEAMKQIYRSVGKQLPSSFVDKWNAWRYLAMLGNPRTWGRNIIGNAMFSPVVTAKNLTATAIESAVNRVSGGKTGRTKSIVTGATEGDRALLSAAWKDYVNAENAVMGGGKYNDSALANKQIEEGRQIFGRVEQAKTTAGKVVSGTLGKAVEAARKGTTKVMDAGDQWFAKPHYASALASYCKANGITAEQIQKGEGLDEARAYAVKEAQKATYRDTNVLSEAVSQMGRYTGKNPVRKGLSVAVEGILPFRKTPANILARGLEYSPAGIVKALAYDSIKVKQGEMTAAELIDDLSAGLTGTGLMALGVYMAAQGLIRGHGSGDEKEKEFEELMGHQAYALEVGNTSITLDWLAPEVLPFFVGVNLWEATEGGEKPATMADVLSAIGLVGEPLLEMSCLQSVNDAFEAVQYAESDGMDYLPAVLASAATSYLTQAIPALSGQLERITQGERMTTYTTKGNENLTTDMQYTVGSASGKLPGIDFQQIPYIDAWGRTEDSGSVGERMFDNMLNPAYVSTIETSDMEAELERLYDETGEKTVFPTRADKYFSVNGERLDLSADQYVKYAETKGQTSYDILSELTASKAYSAMSDADKVEVIGWTYEYANSVAKAKVSDYKLSGWVEKAERAAANGVSVTDYILYKQAVAAVSTDGNTNTSQAEAEAALNKMGGLTDEQKAFLWQSTNSSWKADNNPFR